MKKILLLFCILFSSIVYANDYVEIVSKNGYEYHNHDTYEVWFNTVTKNPAYVIWDLTNDEAILSDQSSNRANGNFVACGSAKSSGRNYPKTSMDAGHMCPSNDRDWSLESSKNTFRACNICPQTPKLNRGIWKKYEKKGHEMAEKYGLVTIIALPYYNGSLGSVYIGKDLLRVPDGFFKIFVYKDKGKLVTLAYNFLQTNEVKETTIDMVETVSNIKIIFKE